MIKLRVFLLGALQSGKTELLKQLINPDYMSSASKTYTPSLALDFQTIPVGEGVIQIWDTSGNLLYQPLVMHYARGVEVGIYCVNLSQAIDEDEVNRIKKQIHEFKTINPQVAFILVGTQSDRALPNALARLQEQIHYEVIPVSTYQKKGTVVLREQLIARAKEVNLLLKARNGCLQGSALYEAVDDLYKSAQKLHLSAQQIDLLGKELFFLLNQLNDPMQKNKVDVLNAFLDACYGNFYDVKADCYAAIMVLAAAIAVTLIAGLIGFSIGVALGAWTGPAAFFTAFTLGNNSAAWFVAGTAVPGMSALLISSHCFFHNPVLELTNDFAEKLNKNIYSR